MCVASTPQYPAQRCRHGVAGPRFSPSLIWLGCLDSMRSPGWLGSLRRSWLRIVIYLRMRRSVKDWGGETFIDVDRVLLKPGKHLVEHVGVSWGRGVEVVDPVVLRHSGDCLRISGLALTVTDGPHDRQLVVEIEGWFLVRV